MEMMVVLLIVAIIAAATAPMVTKKMARNAGSGDSPWVFTGLNNNIAYNMNGSDSSAIIGALSYNNNGGPTRPRLVLASGNDANHPALAFADSNGVYSGQIDMNRTTSVVKLNDATVGNNSVAIGMNQSVANIPQDLTLIGSRTTLTNNTTGSVIIGSYARAVNQRAISIGTRSNLGLSNTDTTAGLDSIAIGTAARAAGDRSIAIGAAFQNTGALPSQAMVNSNSENSIAIGPASYAVGDNSVAIGRGAWVNTNSTIQNNTKVDNAIAIGSISTASRQNSTAVGNNAQATGEGAIAIGHNAEATGDGSIAFGDSWGSFHAEATKDNSIAIGNSASSTHARSVAIGSGARTTADDQIVLGQNNTTVYIPGNIIIGGNMVLANKNAIYFKAADNRWYNQYDRGKTYNADRYYIRVTQGSVSLPSWASKVVSDRRLKNVGEKYTAGLDELKKLDFYHYTFKKDEAKTPMVGVMAQDLQKVFPDAVTKGEDGYLRIRLEDMFYAVINAVKELDSKISEIVADITSIKTTIKSQQETIDSLQKENAELKEEIKSIEKRIEKLEK